MLLFVLADAGDDSTVTVNLWTVLLALAIVALLVYILRHRHRL
jgi:hypothetical protein